MLLTLLPLLLLTPVCSLRVLGLFPHRGRSHFHFVHPIMRGLADAGHSVHVLSSFPDREAPAGYKDYALPDEEFGEVFDLDMFKNRNFMYHYGEFFMLYDLGRENCNSTLQSKQLAQILAQPPAYYDVIILEQFNTDCMMGVAHRLQAPVIAVSSTALMPWHLERMGVPKQPSYIPTQFLANSQHMSLSERLANWITLHSFNWLYKLFNERAADELLRQRFGPDMPSVDQLVKTTALFFVNQHYSLSGPKPLPPNVIELGGIHITQAKPLPTELQRLLDNAEHGVVLISWGSLIRASSLPDDKRDGIVRALARLKQQVIWKWENETLPNQPENVHVMKWLPQRDILCHPNVKVFMSHGGLMGSSEAVHCAVPIVGTPIYGDQFMNVAALEQRGMAVLLRFEDISEHTVHAAITKALDESYKAHASAVASCFNERPQTPLQTALWWVEHVATTKGAPLTQSSAVHLSRFVYYSLDVYLVVAGALLLVGALVLGLRRLCCARKTPKAKPKRN